MDDIFMRELAIFAAVLVVFVGTIPMMIRGHHAEPVEAAHEAASRTAEGDVSSARGKSKRRRARERDAKKKKA